MSEPTMLARDADSPLTLRQRLDHWRPGAPEFRQLWLLFGVAIAIAAGLWVFTWSQRPGLVPLYAGLAAKDAGAVVEALRATGVPFRIDPGTGAITVPEERVHELRMKLAAQGLPEGNPSRGIESISGDQGFGVSQFIEGARYQHALETELARSISTLRPVQSARVHLAIPKPTAFARDHGAASASVVLELHTGQSLEPNQVAAIVRMVSSSIPGMSAAAVTVVDQTGHLLTNPDPDSQEAETARQFAQQRQMEGAYAERIRSLLTPLAGPGRVTAQVNVDMDYSLVEEASETYGSEPQKMRSEQVTEQTNGTPPPVGVPGATSNAPPGAQAAGGATGGSSSRSSARNFELDRTLTHTRQMPGRIRRLTVAVLVDHVPQEGAKGAVSYRPLTADEMTRVENLVKQAVGFEEERGDAISVVNVPFVRPETAKPVAEPPLWEQIQQAPPMVKDSLRLLVAAVVLLALIFGVLRPAMRQLVPEKAPPLPEPEVAPPLLSGPAAADGLDAAGQRALPSSPAQAYEDAFQRAREAVGEDPRRVAQVIKNWVNNNG